jgi:hypothetical protein
VCIRQKRIEGSNPSPSATEHMGFQPIKKAQPLGWAFLLFIPI